ncbi:hypothetical protein EVAR_92775_1 [Eumeta japonica]|uniref:Uncharacterized protein n=1 Tax=Eumeta variegata TaxID=151549 RepID=A0A4C1SXG2_EUMVA|nr:hypothetical protein EVAR_92775_1 [Eumeta japonica]
MVPAQLSGAPIKNNRKFHDRITAIICTCNSYQFMTTLQAIIRKEEESTQPIQTRTYVKREEWEMDKNNIRMVPQRWEKEQRETTKALERRLKENCWSRMDENCEEQ